MDCPHIPEIPLSEFSQGLQRVASAERVPLGASIELTERCNLRCVHCYINQPAGDREVQGRELSCDQWARILEEMAAAGCLWLVLTGGEPLLRRDFKDIYLHAKKLGMIIILFSNGTLITPELADFLAEWSPYLVEITVYGRTRATYEAVTRVPGSFDKCLQGIDLLLARKVPLELKSMAMTLNAHEIMDLQAWAQGLGLRFRYDAVLNPRLDGGKEPLALRLTPEEVVEFDRQDEARLKALHRFADQFVKPLQDNYLYHCGAGVVCAHVDPYGKMYLCLMAREAGFDLTQGSWDEGWRQFLPRLRYQKPRGDYPCGRCGLIVLCGQCPAWGRLEHDDPQKPVTYLCQIAHLRAAALGLLKN